MSKRQGPGDAFVPDHSGTITNCEGKGGKICGTSNICVFEGQGQTCCPGGTCMFARVSGD